MAAFCSVWASSALSLSGQHGKRRCLSPGLSFGRARSSPRVIMKVRTQQPAERETAAQSENHSFFATCPRGLGTYLAAEIESPHVNGTVVDVAASGVRFESPSFDAGMRACLWLRTAIRVLHEVAHSDFGLRSENRKEQLDGEDVYRFVREEVDWGDLIGARGLSFSIKVRVSGTSSRPESRGGRRGHGRFHDDRFREGSFSRHGGREPVFNDVLVQVRAKDAICDAVRDAGFDKPLRPESHAAADLPIFVVVHQCSITIYRDMAGSSLHKRGYKDSIPIHRASLNETVASGMAYLAGLTPEGTFENASTVGSADSSGELTVVDPMCGSGTILTETALCIKQVAVGLFRSDFAFERWDDFDPAAFSAIVAEAEATAKKFEHRQVNLIGNDINKSAISLARQVVRNAGLSECIQLCNYDIRDFDPRRAPTLVMSNPPWGMRLAEEEDAWVDMGDFLRQHCTGSTAVLMSGDMGLTRGLRMRARQKHPVRIGNVDTRVLLYDVLSYEQVLELSAKRRAAKTNFDRKD